jgi:glutathione S-transferase
MLKFYYSGAPNPTKVALFLEETGTPYDPIPIDTRKGEQHKPEFLAINPNAKLPAIVDGNVKVFDSSAILLYLAEKTGKFLPAKTDKARGELLSWMFFVSSGVAILVNRCISAFTRRRRFLTLPIAMPLKRSAMPAFSMRGLPSRNTCSATPIRSST